MSNLFISYRRDDSADVTGRLHDRLKGHFGDGTIFLDIDTIPFGLDFRQCIGDAVNQCDVLLAVIGDNWLDARYADGPKQGSRRLDDPHDYVRIEIESALARGIPVVPLLVGKASMPAEAQLPDVLNELAFRNAAEVRSGPDFQGHVDRLIRGLDQLLERNRYLRARVDTAKHNASNNPKMALRAAREVLELVVRDVYERRFHEPPGTRPLESLIQRIDSEGGLPGQFDATALVGRLSEPGTARWNETLAPADVHQSLTQLTEILKWYIEVEQPDALGQAPAQRPQPRPAPAQPVAQSNTAGSEARIAIVPKGLRSFDANDSDFFLQLLPGPRDKEGLPESIRFWKHRIESRDDPSFTVGVIYGPSGCGKSSLVKAGLLPRLAGRVISVYLEATPGETEARIQSGLRKKLPALDSKLDLTGTITALRHGRGLGPDQKILLVVDQFEQWLHARRGEQETELAQALRQCDGDHVQCIVMVRDDFWVSLSRFMGSLRIEIVQGQNAALVDLFDLIHARNVLHEFGRAFGRLPASDGAIARDQETFLAQAIEGLAQDGRVISIRLALFAEMVKGKPWVAATLKEVGGTQGVGVTFLEETFRSAALRAHQKAGQAVLKALLPESGSNIKGNMQSHHELLEASGYANRPQDLDALLRVLDHDLRLITPTEPEGVEGGVWGVEGGAGTVEGGAGTVEGGAGTVEGTGSTLEGQVSNVEGESSDDRAELPGAGSLAVRHGPRGEVLPGDEDFFQGRVVRADESNRARGVINPGQHRRGSGEGPHQGVPQAPEHRPRIADGAGNAPDAEPAGGFVATGGTRQLAGADRSHQQNAERPPQSPAEAPGDLTTGHPSTPHPPPPTRFYQLTHDYLVPSLREWLTRKQKETRRGRAELRLAERAALWNARPESRHLPSAVEWANIRLLTEKQKWTGLERRMMKQAGRLHGLRALGVAAGLLVLVLAGLDIRRRVVEANEQTIAGESVKSLVRVKIAQVPDIVKSMAKYRRWVDPALREVVARSSEGSPERLHASIALLPVDEGQVEYLYNRLLAADADDVSVLRESLKPHQASLIPKLWTVLDSSRPGDAGLLPAASSLAIYDPGNARWAQAGAKVAEAIVQVNAIDLRPWLEALRPVRGKLTASLAAVFREKPRSPIEHSQATNILTDYAGDEPGLIAGLLMDSDNKAYASFFPIAAGHAARTLQLFEEELAKKPAFSGSDSPPVISEEAKDQLAERQARAAVALVRMGKIDEVLPKLAHSPDPRLRSFILNWLKSLGADPRIIAAELHRLDAPATRHSPLVGRGSPDPARSADRRSPSSGATPDSGRPSVTERAGSGDPRPTLSGDPRPTGSGDLAAANPDSPATRHSPPATQRMDAILFHPETSIRRALILALGTYGPDAFSPSEREPLIRNLLKLYTDDPDSGIHGAAEWTLRQFNEQAKLKSAAADLTKLKDRGDRRWLVNSQGQAFVLIEGPVEFTMGSPPTEPDRNSIEALHRRLIPRRFAIATKEVTVEEYQAFMRENPGSHGLSIDKYSPDPKGPMNGPSWFDAAAYCNWLSKKEGLAEDQWCYVRNAKGEYDSEMTIPADILKRKGYRLPTEAEWEYACRAGAVTSRCYGLSLDLLAKYARYSGNSAERAWPGGSLLPNDLGLFDMLGNVYEWCNERYYDYQAVGDRVSVDNINTSEHVDINPRILRGGSFFSHAALVRSALRFWNAPANRNSDIGFRPSRTYD